MPHAYIAGILSLRRANGGGTNRSNKYTSRRHDSLSASPRWTEGKLKGPENICREFVEDRDAIDRADIVIANLNGITTDDGTAWELGYAYAKANIWSGFIPTGGCNTSTMVIL
ncbi:MAG: nucleoside 2-deoxyribosyltransferase [Anaerolineae bacterium]